MIENVAFFWYISIYNNENILIQSTKGYFIYACIRIHAKTQSCNLILKYLVFLKWGTEGVI